MLSREITSSSPWPADGGAMGALMRDTDWSALAAGAPSAWPASLRTVIDLMLPAHAQIVLFWGPQFVAFYNDAYAPTIGNKHPRALGRPAVESWTELWDDLHPLLASVRDTGRTFSDRDRPFQIERHGYLEEVYFDISYSAVRDEDGSVGGVLCLVSETTERVLSVQKLQKAEDERRVDAERIELALNAGAVVGTWVWDVPNDRVTADEAFCRTFGLDAAVMKAGVPIGTVKQPIHPDDLARVDGLIDNALAQGGRFRAEYRIASADGWRWVEANGHVELDATGRANRFPGALIDIGVRKQAERTTQNEIAARRKAEDDLEETHSQFRLAQEAAGIGVFSLDIASDMLTVSPEFCRLFGLPVSATMPARVAESMHRGEAGSSMSDAGGRREGSSPLETEYRIERASDGEIRWLARRAEYVRGAEGRPTAMMGIVQDITSRKLAEATLSESRARFQVLAQAMPNQVWTATAEGLLDWFNERIHAYSGRSHDELAGGSWIRIVHPDDAEAALALWTRSLATGQPYETEFRIRRRDGVYRWHIIRALPVEYGQGPLRWIGTNTDIDEQKATQAEMARLNESLELRVAERSREIDRIWRLSTDLMIVARLDGTIHSVNPAWTTLLGWHPSELLGRPVEEFVHPDDHAETAREQQSLAQGRAALRFENRYRHRDGSHRVISWTAVPEDGFVHAVGRDITPERAAAATLRETEERLRQSQKMEAVGQLTGGIAHDFNNLLQGISGSLEVVRKRIAQGRPDDVERFVAGAIGATHRAAALTHRLLAFSRRQPLDPKPVKANPLVGSMEDLFRRTLGEHIGLEMVLAGGLWTTLCDPNQLESALLNLAINARDAMPAGGTLVIETCNAHLDSAYASVSRGLKPGQYVCIAVTDSGTGMPPEVVARAFDPFFTTKPIGQGTGLGLSMIYGFTLQSEGFCKIYSEVGKGTTVKLYLPRHRGEDTVSLAPSAPAASPADDGQTVLVIEDEPVVRNLIVDLLSDLGYTTLQASDGPSGLALIESGAHFDLLISDIGLPGLNGRQVVEAARRIRPDMRVLFMTGYAENAALAHGFLEPGMEMITKPFAIDALALRVQEMLQAVTGPATRP